MRLGRCVVLVGFLMFGAAPAQAGDVTFAEDSLIIPMDTTYQPLGLFKTFGMVQQLLLANVPVYWAIKPGKQVGNPGDADFTATAEDVLTSAPITGYGYRGGPWVIAAADASAAMAVIGPWQTANPTTTVHHATAAFVAPISRTLTAAPTIGVFADGNEDVAFGYLNAAGLKDRLGQSWPTNKLGDYSAYPDVLTAAQVAGPSYSAPNDGKLFDANGLPVYCQLMTMHWGCKTGCGNPDALQDAVVLEMASFLTFPTHLFAECQAVTAIERNPNGRFVAPGGVWIDGDPKADVVYRQGDLPFAQMDGPFTGPGGSEPSYALCDPAKHDGDTYPNCTLNHYYDNGIVMITQPTTPLVGVRDVWMTGYARGVCDIGQPTCGAMGAGKVSYLGGHRYTTALPLANNPKSQGTRLFLNSLFEAACASAEGQPQVSITKSGPAGSTDPAVTYKILVGNAGPGIAIDVRVDDPLPTGAVFVSASHGGTESGGHVRWSLGNLGGGDMADITLVLSYAAAGYATYINHAHVVFDVGLNEWNRWSNDVQTVYAATCTASCAGKTCGADDGCAHPCVAGSGCCAVSCTGLACGTADGCGGTCQPGSGCTCTGSCAGLVCGEADPCGATCAPGSGCCEIACAGKTCGQGDGCGGICAPGSSCCETTCATAACFADDGCGSTCAPGSGCTCAPACDGVVCGDADGCGGSCEPGSGCVDDDGGVSDDGGAGDGAATGDPGGGDGGGSGAEPGGCGCRLGGEAATAPCLLAVLLLGVLSRRRRR